MPEQTAQQEAASYIKSTLSGRGHDIPYKSLKVGEETWIVFERGPSRVGIDSGSGVWLKESEENEGRCIEKPCTVSGALEAVEFLIKD